VPYKYGGMTKRGIDCSGFASLVYKECFGKSIPRISSDQYEQGTRVTQRNLQSGDLVFFSNVRYGKIDHVGIFLGNKRFVHATESSGVTISLLSEKYYEKRYAGARRY
jgi:cell wall-associated NlpC family hydrolase